MERSYGFPSKFAPRQILVSKSILLLQNLWQKTWAK
jgi:hypothetical protein